MPVSVLAATIIVLMLMALAAGTLRVRAEPNLAKPGGGDCALQLVASGVAVERSAHPARNGDMACVIVDPVRLHSVADPALPARRITFPEKPLLSCAMAERLARFAADIAAPLALGIHGKELVSLATGPGHECRPRNRRPGAKTSSHGQGNAVDIMGFELHGGLRVSVEKPEGAEAARLIAGIRAAACGVFSTVLGPGSDSAHANHLHLDIEQRGRDGRSKLCQ